MGDVLRRQEGTMRGFIILTAALFLTSCGSSSGTKIDAAQMSQFKIGVTTYDQVVQALGPPASTVQKSDGTRALVYSHMDATVRGATFIPVVGMFAGGADVKSQGVIFTFNPDTTLREYATTESQACSGNGVMSGASAQNCQNR